MINSLRKNSFRTVSDTKNSKYNLQSFQITTVVHTTHYDIGTTAMYISVLLYTNV